MKDPGNFDEVWDFIFDALAEVMACLGCAGPPECKLDCEPGPKYDTGFGSYSGVMELEIDGHKYEVKVRKVPHLEQLAEAANETTP